MVISLQLVEIEVLQPASVDPTEDAKEADLVEGLIHIVKKISDITCFLRMWKSMTVQRDFPQLYQSGSEHPS